MPQVVNPEPVADPGSRGRLRRAGPFRPWAVALRSAAPPEPRVAPYHSRVSPDEMMLAAIAAADEGMAAGELPIGAVVFMGDQVVGRAFTQEIALRRRVVHADLLAVLAADELLGRGPRRLPLKLAVNLEPCMMCLGAAMAWESLRFTSGWSRWGMARRQSQRAGHKRVLCVGIFVRAGVPSTTRPPTPDRPCQVPAFASMGDAWPC